MEGVSTRCLHVRTLVALVLLGCGAPSAVAQPTTGEPRRDDLAMDLRAYAETLCQAGPDIVVGESAPGPCDAVDARLAGDGSLRAAVADVRLGGQLWSVLAVQGAGEHLVGTLASGWSPGVGAHSTEGSTTIEERDLVAGGASEIVATFAGIAGDSDMGSCDFTGYEAEVRVVCSVDSGTLRCVAFTTRSVHVEEHTLCGDVLDADGDGDREEPLTGEVAFERRTGFDLAFAIDADRVTLTPTPAWASTEAPPLAAGTLTVTQLFGRADLVWPAHYEPARVLVH